MTPATAPEAKPEATMPARGYTRVSNDLYMF